MTVHSFLGAFGFYLRKAFPRLCGKAYLAYLRLVLNRPYREFIAQALALEYLVPRFIHIETINRCNGSCPFCPCNKHHDRRPLKKMSEDLFDRIISDLAGHDYDGILMLSGNCEPFLDDRIVKFINIANEKIPKAQKILYTNGTLLTAEKLKGIAGKLDILYVNNYSRDYRLIGPVGEIYEYVKTHAADFRDMRVKIELRYADEVLSNKRGEAPNNRNAKTIYRNVCPHPYMETIIFPDGLVGLCCNDSQGETNFGDLKTAGLYEIFNSEKLRAVRWAMKDGRNGYEFCQYCDFMSQQGRRLKWMKSGRD